MALNQEFFDSIQIDVVKRKYYNANKVNAVFDDIRLQAQELINENESLRSALSAKGEEYENARKRLQSLQAVYRETMEKARVRADAIEKEAEERAKKLLMDAEEKNTRAERLVKECLGRIRKTEEENIAFLNSQMQLFLRELEHGEGNRRSPEETYEPEEVPSDENLADSLEHRISLLAKEIRELENN